MVELFYGVIDVRLGFKLKIMYDHFLINWKHEIFPSRHIFGDVSYILVVVGQLWWEFKDASVSLTLWDE